MVRSAKRVSNHEAPQGATSFETRRNNGAPQDEEPGSILLTKLLRRRERQALANVGDHLAFEHLLHQVE